jgi:hypothetical protein
MVTWGNVYVQRYTWVQNNNAKIVYFNMQAQREEEETRP